MATKKRASTTRRTTSGTRRSTTTSTRRRTTTSTRRRTRSTPTAVGGALGVALATFLVDMSWPARLGLIALAFVVLAAYLLVRARRTAPGEPDATDAVPQTGPGPASQPGPGPMA